MEVDKLSDAICPISWGDEVGVLQQCNNESGVLLVGDFVTRGPHWKQSVYGDQDGGEDTVGRVCLVDTSCGSVSVLWFKTEKEYVYTYILNDIYEVSLILTRCPGKHVKYRHWQNRCTSVPAECDGMSSFKCKLCRLQHEAHQLAEMPPFYCTSCRMCICLKCYHTKQPPACGIKSRFSLSSSRQMLTIYSPALTEDEVEAALTSAGGDVELAIAPLHCTSHSYESCPV